MKALRVFFLVCTFILIFGAAAGAQDFIFKYNEESGIVMPMSADFEQEHLAGPFYLSDNEAELQRLFEAGIIEYYGPDASVELMDIANDARYESQRDYEFMLTNAVGVVNNGVYDGRGVRVGIIDTGLAENVEDIDYEKVVARKNVASKTTNTEETVDYIGHGTAVAGVIAAINNNGIGVSSLTPGVELVIIKAFPDKSQTTSVSDLLKGLEYAVSQGCDVVNMSVGATETMLNSVALKSMGEYIDKISAKGVIVVAAAGNHEKSLPNDESKDSPFMYPAAFENVVSVASIDDNGHYSSFSFHNAMVDIAACGGSVSLLRYNDPTGTFTNSGTSFSSPYIASVAALVKQLRPDITVSEFKELLASTAYDAGDPGWDPNYGYGIVNVGRLMDSLVGRNITVSDIVPDGWDSAATIVNNGFDSYEIMDIWFMEADDGTHSRNRIKTITIEPRSSIDVSYTGWLTVKHLVWLKENLEPLSPASEHETGIA